MTLSRRQARKAFTMIELLLVIGIILLLIGMFFLGIKYITNNARINDTKTAFETAKTLWANYEQATGLQRNPQSPTGTADSNATPPINYWLASTSYADASKCPPASDAWSDTTDYPQLEETAYVMYALESVPENLKIIQNLPSRKTALTPFKIAVTINGSVVDVQVPILLDGWGNPLIFCPAGGLQNVLLGGQQGAGTSVLVPGTFVTVTNLGNFPSTASLPASGLQPFFASAGPDGIMGGYLASAARGPSKGTGDDNLYSFQ